MELALRIGKLVDKWCLIVYIFTLVVIIFHFIGFVKVGRFRNRFLHNND